ncbi:metalloregulator ArsR/SmtB family transcription factor [Radiobacillus kanasensis]|uniref:ArsR/SmtB family transcription factor n=1 Tax=Radiobacillus kanasensis TaxID=2844358 RepID=UPI001E2C5FC4|nr:metalloregulator ArsR/SmtB family transcription factor [Radiobacillus kanasensis]UFU00422.1 metalloregulator ArsR/SmtB family transcription factor [Radiobacillus kanasensis]
MTRIDTCDIYCYNEEKVQSVRKAMEQENLNSVSKMFKVLADENRAKIAYALSQDGELCVCDIANIIGATVATASHHLRTLSKQGMVRSRKEGKLVFYSMVNPQLNMLIQTALAYSKGAEVYA